MPSIYQLKPKFQDLLRPICKMLAKFGFTANQVTLFTSFCSLIYGLCLYFYSQNNWIFFIFPLVLFVRMALNAIDGMLAREFKMQSHLGIYLNELGDVFSDLFIYVPLAFHPLLNFELVILINFLAIITEMTGVISFQVSGFRNYDGPMGKSDRAFIFSLLALSIGFELEIINYSYILLILVNILLLKSIGNRIRSGLKKAI